jgi:hypothetical protein
MATTAPPPAAASAAALDPFAMLKDAIADSMKKLMSDGLVFFEFFLSLLCFDFVLMYAVDLLAPQLTNGRKFSMPANRPPTRTSPS